MPDSSATSRKAIPSLQAEAIELPEFDSIPATAGLSNLQAFQLSLRHALTLLPQLPPNLRAARDAADLPERFRLS